MKQLDQINFETERHYRLQLTELEMNAIGGAIVLFYKTESTDSTVPKDKTLLILKAMDKFKKALDSDNYVLIKKEDIII